MPHDAPGVSIGAPTRPALAGRLPSIVAPALALAYPYLLMAYRGAIDRALHGTDGALWPWLSALGLLALGYGVPVAALLLALRLAAANAAPAARRLALLAVAAPPMWVLWSSIHGSLPLRGPWVALWGLLLLAGWAGGRGSARPAPSPLAGAALARRIHANALVSLTFAAYLLFHVANQLSGLLGAATYDRVMKLGRVVYRSPLVEPILVGVILLLLLSSLYLLWRDSVVRQDRFRTLQLAAGCYLIFFLLSHLNAALVFGRRFLNGNTGFAFATGGPAGLLRSESLLPYYGLAVFFALLHVVLGLRHALLRRGARKERADRLVVLVGTAGAVVALAIMAGLVRSSWPQA